MKIFVLYRPTHTDRCIVILEETSVVRMALPPNFHTVLTYSYGKIESMLSNFRNVIERHSNSSTHGSPPPPPPTHKARFCRAELWNGYRTNPHCPNLQISLAVRRLAVTC